MASKGLSISILFISFLVSVCFFSFINCVTDADLENTKQDSNSNEDQEDVLQNPNNLQDAFNKLTKQFGGKDGKLPMGELDTKFKDIFGNMNKTNLSNDKINEAFKKLNKTDINATLEKLNQGDLFKGLPDNFASIMKNMDFKKLMDPENLKKLSSTFGQGGQGLIEDNNNNLVGESDDLLNQLNSMLSNNNNNNNADVDFANGISDGLSSSSLQDGGKRAVKQFRKNQPIEEFVHLIDHDTSAALSLYDQNIYLHYYLMKNKDLKDHFIEVIKKTNMKTEKELEKFVESSSSTTLEINDNMIGPGVYNNMINAYQQMQKLDEIEQFFYISKINVNSMINNIFVSKANNRYREFMYKFMKGEFNIDQIESIAIPFKLLIANPVDFESFRVKALKKLRGKKGGGGGTSSLVKFLKVTDKETTTTAAGGASKHGKGGDKKKDKKPKDKKSSHKKQSLRKKKE